MKIGLTIKNTLLLAGLCSILLLLAGCESPKRTPGICLSFDDRSIKEWYALKEMLHAQGAKVTFFVTQFDSLSPDEIKMLKELQDDGHEIASHGALHVQAEDYIRKHSYTAYLENEIDASVDVMQRNGFNPTSFAYPYGSKYWFTDFLLLKRFKITRGIVALKNEELFKVDEAYYSFNGTKKIAAAEIDAQTRLSKEMIQQAMERSLLNKEVLLLCGHEPNDTVTRAYTFNTQFLDFILEEANRRHLKYYRVSDLVGE